jgi:retron-type reverse transcriptase
MERVGEKIADSRVLSLIRGMLQAGVMDRMKGWQATEQGSPQGAVISPLLSNIYLNGLDWKMARKGFEIGNEKAEPDESITTDGLIATSPRWACIP